jgi:aspartyl protease family protein
MLRFTAIAVAAALSAAGAARALAVIDRPQPAKAQTAAELRRMPSQAVYDIQPAARPGTASVVKSADGHFWAEAVVNDKRVRFLVDTGASAVALTPADARRLGFDPATLAYTGEVATANGKARVALINLDSVSVAGARVTGVQAFVVENGLETSLLGMTYLGRLSRFEATQQALILRP